MKCMISLSVKITFFWALLIISVWEIEPKTKETTVNYFALRHYWSIEEWEQWVSKTIRQNRMGFSYIFSWSCQVWLLSQPFFPSVSVISAVTAYNVGVFKILAGFHFSITEVNSKRQSSFLFSLKVELMLLLAILNRLKSFRWYFVMFAINWIYWKVELLQHVNMKHNNKCYWYVKSFHFTIFWQVFVLHFNPTIFHKL